MIAIISARQDRSGEGPSETLVAGSSAVAIFSTDFVFLITASPSITTTRL
jgi:hypothetical protein